MSANPSGFAAYCDQQMARWNLSTFDAPDTFSREMDTSLLSHVTHTNWWETEGQDLPHRPQPQRRRWSSSDSDASDDLYMRPTPTALRNRHQSSNRANEMLGWHQRDQSWPLQCPSNAVAPLRDPFPLDGWSPRAASARDATEPSLISDTHQPPPLHDLWFLDRSPKGTATLTFLNEQGNPQSISHVDLKAIEQSCPLLAVAFEQSRSGPQLFLQTLTTKTAIPFLEFLHTDSYRVAGPNGSYAGDVPTSLLLHCQMYHLGDMYAVEQLKTQAYANVFRQCEFACSSPNQPIHLCAAIRFLYGSLPTHEGLINTVIDYCVSRFLEHKLGQDEEFKQLAYDLRPFHQALCRNSRERNFDHEAATAIIQLPFKPYAPDTYASRDDPGATRFDRDVFRFHTYDKFDAMGEKSQMKRKRPEPPVTMKAEPAQLPAPTFWPHLDIKEADDVPEKKGQSSGASSKRRLSSNDRLIRLAKIVHAHEDADRATPTSLLLRPRQKSSEKTGNGLWEDVKAGSSKTGSKQRLWSIADTLAPVKPEIAVDTTLESKLPIREKSPVSDGEFTIVPRPAAVEALSDSGSDDDSLVEIKHEDAESDANVSQCQKGGTAPAAKNQSDDEEDWEEWQEWEDVPLL